jgi:heptosyltransferase I
MNKSITSRRVLFIRMDRIGDLILTLPADQNSIFKNDEKFWFISQGLGFIPQQAQPTRFFTEWKKSFSWQQLFSFIRKVREIQPDISVSFQSPWWVTLALFFARVPVRVGVLSSWHSFLFLNRGLRQKRSRCEKHELDYNHELIQKTLAPHLPAETSNLVLTASSLQTNLPTNYVVIHPGMAGSALNWPLTHYKTLIENLSVTVAVIITGTVTDRLILSPLKQQLQTQKNIFWYDEKLSATELLSVLKQARVVFAPSTGVIHLAASLNVPTFGIYSPVVVQRSERWGPRGEQVQTWTPQVNCPAHFKCLGSACRYFNCMELVSPQEIEDNILQKLNN